MIKPIIIILSVMLISACQTQNIQPSSSRSNNHTESGHVVGNNRKITTTKKTLVISALKKSKSRQHKNGISITVEPINNVPSLWYRISLKERFSPLILNKRYKYTETHKPYYKTSNRLKFRVKISNKSNRVFRPKSAVITFNIDGESASLSPKGYSDFTKAIIVPNSSKTITFYGPKVKNLQKKNGVFHLGMYDVATGKSWSNFEWYMKYKTNVKKKKHAIKKMNVELTKYEAAERRRYRYKAQ